VVLMLAGIDDPKLDNTTSHPSSSSHSLLDVLSVIPGTLRRRLWVVWFYGLNAHASFTSTVVICWSAVGFGYGYGRK